MKNRLHTTLVIICLVVLLGINAQSLAETFRYKDEHGHWSFSDSPMPGLELYENIESEIEKKPPVKDLMVQLYQKFPPRTPIEEATLAVVAIKTPLYKGSGFFFSEDGYILTNKHIVKPSELDKDWEREEGITKKWEEVLKEAEEELYLYSFDYDYWKKEFENCENKLYKPYAGKYKQERIQDWEKHCRYVSGKYFEFEEFYAKIEKEFDLVKKKFDAAKDEAFWKRSEAMFARSFKIFLKDETELKANLVATSKENDLALLKLDGYKTPFLKAVEPQLLSQGLKVFAIGLFGLRELDDEEKLEYKEKQDEEEEGITKIILEGGLKDAVTSGVITRIKNGLLVTDTHIFPGYSGGPLVDEQGRVIGVNSHEIYRTGGGEHLGISTAISIDIAIREFKKFLQDID